MKTTLRRSLVMGALLFPVLASAELIFYKGVRRESFHGEGRTLAVHGKFLMVVDHQTARVATIEYVNINGQKRYSTSEWTDTHFVQIRGLHKTYTAIARPPTECEIQSGVSGEGVYCSGANSLLTLNTNSSISFPKVLKDAGNGISFAQTTGDPVLGEGSFQVTFDRPGTLASNKEGESLDEAFARLVRYVESLGHTR